MAKSWDEKIAVLEAKLALLRERRKKLMKLLREQQKKERIKRQGKRGLIIEDVLPETVNMTDEYFKEFLQRIIPINCVRHELTAILEKQKISLNNETPPV